MTHSLLNEGYSRKPSQSHSNTVKENNNQTKICTLPIWTPSHETDGDYFIHRSVFDIRVILGSNLIAEYFQKCVLRYFTIDDRPVQPFTILSEVLDPFVVSTLLWVILTSVIKSCFPLLIHFMDIIFFQKEFDP